LGWTRRTLSKKESCPYNGIMTQFLLDWYRHHGRDLPWRRTHDPYKILVSEIMLQQTQVPRVLLFYGKWLEQFPDWKSLADASNAEVLRAWAGLGYNRRALALRNIARQIVEGKNVPKTAAQWMELKGIGPYTGAAVSVFSSSESILPIDTNIRRILGRVLLGLPFPQPEHDKRIRCIAKNWMPADKRFADTTQALFDLAASICTKNPSCAICPLRNECRAASKFLSGHVRIPKAMIRKGMENKRPGKPSPDRIYRGRILSLARIQGSKGLPIKKMGSQVDPSFDPREDQVWMNQMVKRMEKDGLVKIRSGKIFLE